MRVLLANFKHFYQRRGLWIVYPALGVVVWSWTLSGVTRGKGLFGGLLLGSFLVGLMVAALQKETSSKPFSFCLPGHHAAVRNIVFLAGLVVNLVSLLICDILLTLPSVVNSLGLARLPSELLLVVLGSYFCASVTAYLLGAGLVFTTIYSASALSLMTLVVALCALFDVFPAVEYPIAHWPVAMIALALVVGRLSWWWLGRPAWFRRSCVAPWTGFFDAWDRSQIERRRALHAARFTKNIPLGLDRFFQRAIALRRPSSFGKYAWGVLYTTAVLIVPQWKGLLMAAVLAVACTMYFPSVAPSVLAVVFFMMTGLVHPPLATSLLVAGGRRERFLATVTLILVLGVVSTLAVGTLAGLTHLLAPLMPVLRWKGYAVTPQAISVMALLVPLALLPVVSLMQTLFYRKTVWLAFSIMLVLIFLLASSTPLGLYQAMTPPRAAVGTLLSWVVCMAILYRIAMRSDLVRQ